MLNEVKVVNLPRLWLGALTTELLNQFEVLVIIDNNNVIDNSVGTVDWDGGSVTDEMNALMRYYRSGHGIGIICEAGEGESYEMADGVLEGLKHALRIAPGNSGCVARAGSEGTKRRSTGSIASDLSNSPNFVVYDSANDFYAKDTHYRFFNGTGPKERTFEDPGTNFSVYTIGGTNVIGDGDDDYVQGTYTNIMIWSTAGDLTGLMNVAFDPAVQVDPVSPYAAGDLPGRMFFDLHARNYRSTGNEAAHKHDHHRMLAKAITWLNRGIVPRTVLIYHTNGRRGDGQCLHPAQHYFGLGHLVEDLLTVTPVDMGSRI